MKNDIYTDRGDCRNKYVIALDQWGRLIVCYHDENGHYTIDQIRNMDHYEWFFEDRADRDGCKFEDLNIIKESTLKHVTSFTTNPLTIDLARRIYNA